LTVTFVRPIVYKIKAFRWRGAFSGLLEKAKDSAIYGDNSSSQSGVAIGSCEGIISIRRNAPMPAEVGSEFLPGPLTIRALRRGDMGGGSG
jgi:hypothetical protein